MRQAVVVVLAMTAVAVTVCVGSLSTPPASACSLMPGVQKTVSILLKNLRSSNSVWVSHVPGHGRRLTTAELNCISNALNEGIREKWLGYAPVSGGIIAGRSRR